MLSTMHAYTIDISATFATLSHFSVLNGGNLLRFFVPVPSLVCVAEVLEDLPEDMGISEAKEALIVIRD